MERVEGFCRVHTDTTEGHAYTYAYQEHIIKAEGFSITDSFVDDTVGETDIHVLEIVGYFGTIGQAAAAIKQVAQQPWIGRGYTFTIEGNTEDKDNG